jgi:hypothetical protein
MYLSSKRHLQSPQRSHTAKERRSQPHAVARATYSISPSANDATPIVRRVTTAISLLADPSFSIKAAVCTSAW